MILTTDQVPSTCYLCFKAVQVPPKGLNYHLNTEQENLCLVCG